MNFQTVIPDLKVKINKHEIWQALTQLKLMCLKYIKGIFNPYAVWRSYFN